MGRNDEKGWLANGLLQERQRKHGYRTSSTKLSILIRAKGVVRIDIFCSKSTKSMHLLNTSLEHSVTFLAIIRFQGR